jgi:hypothetical protein
MTSGQTVTLVSCAASAPGGAVVVADAAFSQSLCPVGQVAYLVNGYLPFVESASYIDGVLGPFDPANAGEIFGFAFGIVVFFYVLGLKGSVLLRPFWRGH